VPGLVVEGVRRDGSGHVDWGLVAGLPNVILTSRFAAPDALETLISFDEGLTWALLKVQDDLLVRGCNGAACALRLHLGHKMRTGPGRWQRE
jgi:hypothetical protein